MIRAEQLSVSPGQTQVRPGQTPVQPQQLAVSPFATAATNGFDITTLLTSIMPLIMIVLVMQMLKPLMAGITKD